MKFHQRTFRLQCTQTTFSLISYFIIFINVELETGNNLLQTLGQYYGCQDLVYPLLYCCQLFEQSRPDCKVIHKNVLDFIFLLFLRRTFFKNSLNKNFPIDFSEVEHFFMFQTKKWSIYVCFYLLYYFTNFESKTVSILDTNLQKH